MLENYKKSLETSKGNFDYFDIEAACRAQNVKVDALPYTFVFFWKVSFARQMVKM